MKINPERIFPLFLRYGMAILFFFTIISIMFYYNFSTIISPDVTDEIYYKNVSNNFTVQHIKYLYENGLESKPLTFLFFQKMMDNANPVWTRTINIIFIIVISFILYDLTKNKLSFLYVLIPIFLDSFWLTVETIEVLFILLSIRYANKSGIFVGIITIIRPTSILYTLTIKRKQIKNVLFIGAIFAIILLVLGLFFPYLKDVTIYTQNSQSNLDISNSILILFTLVMLIIMGLNKDVFKYCLISVIPLYSRLFPHYFVPIFSFLFLGFLINMNRDMIHIVLNKMEE